MKNLFLILILATGPGLYQAFSQPQTIKVAGVAEVSETPELIILNANLMVKAPFYQECFEKSLETYNHLKSVFEENGIDPGNIKSRQIVVNENMEWRNNEKTVLGYYSNIQFEIREEFTPDFSKKLLNSLNTEGLNINYNVSFDFTEKQKEKIRKQALELAIEDAKEKATIIAKTSGTELTKISKINYGVPETAVPFPEYADDDLARNRVLAITEPSRFNMGAVDLNPKEKTIRKMVIVEWYFQVKE